jgi:hypothetical protein
MYCLCPSLISRKIDLLELLKIGGGSLEHPK